MKSHWLGCIGACLWLMAGCGAPDDGGAVSGDSASAGKASTSTGKLRILLHDKPTPAVDEVWVTFDKVTAHHLVNGWITVDDSTQSVDLLKLQNGVAEELGLASMPEGDYDQVRLHLVNSEVKVGGATEPLKVPSGEQSGLKISSNFRVPKCGTVTMTLDWDAGAHLNYNKGQGWILRPVIKVESVTTDWPTSQVLFSDDFNDGSMDGYSYAYWHAHTSNVRWTPTNGKIVRTGGSIWGGGNGVAVTGDPTWTDYAVEANVSIDQISNGGGWGGVVARYQSINKFYALVHEGYGTGKAMLVRKESSIYAVQLAVVPAPIVLGKPNRLRLEVEGHTLRAYMDGNLLAEVQDSVIPSGTAGLIGSSPRITYDNLVVRSLGCVDPNECVNGTPMAQPQWLYYPDVAVEGVWYQLKWTPVRCAHHYILEWRGWGGKIYVPDWRITGGQLPAPEYAWCVNEKEGGPTYEQRIKAVDAFGNSSPYSMVKSVKVTVP